MNAIKAPTAELLRETGSCSVWKVKFPSSHRKIGGTYIVRHAKRNDLIEVLTFVLRRPCKNAGVVTAADRAVRDAIAAGNGEGGT